MTSSVRRRSDHPSGWYGLAKAPMRCGGRDNVAHYTLANGDVFHDGDTIDGPDQALWRVERHAESLLPAPRPVFRVSPLTADRSPG